MGIDHYWIVDLRPGIRLTALRRKGEEYVEQTTVSGTEVLELDEPFPLRLPLADLVD
jgi:hypothetical protein